MDQRPLFLAGPNPMEFYRQDPTILKTKPYFSVYSQLMIEEFPLKH